MVQEKGKWGNKFSLDRILSIDLGFGSIPITKAVGLEDNHANDLGAFMDKPMSMCRSNFPLGILISNI